MNKIGFIGMGNMAKALAAGFLATGKVRGEEGTQVVLTIRRQGQEDFDVTITRAVIQLTTAKGIMVDNTKIGYIRVASFSENTGKEFQKELASLKEQGMEGLIVDLRANPGGLITSCVEISNQLIPAGEIVSMVDRDGHRTVYNSELAGFDYPLVVLIDGNSASASEILAGAVQDRQCGTIVGTKSFGKGSVQNIIPLSDGSALKLTVALYYTPSGSSIQAEGIVPDLEIPFERPREEDADEPRILLREQMDPDKVYYLRFKTVQDNYNKQLFVDYLEWCPKEIYDNPETPEDIW